MTNISVTEMLSKLEWEPLEHRRASKRLTLIYKSINKLAALDTDSYLTKPSSGVSTRKQSAISFNKMPTAKDCYKYSLFPRTFAEWNCLSSDVRNAPTLDSFKTQLESVDIAKLIEKAHFKN